jgi:hypothetical protein
MVLWREQVAAVALEVLYEHLDVDELPLALDDSVLAGIAREIADRIPTPTTREGHPQARMIEDANLDPAIAKRGGS